MKRANPRKPKPIRAGERVVCVYWSAALSCFSSRQRRVRGTVARIVRAAGRPLEYWVRRSGTDGTRLLICYGSEVRRDPRKRLAPK